MKHYTMDVNRIGIFTLEYSNRPSVKIPDPYKAKGRAPESAPESAKPDVQIGAFETSYWYRETK